MAKTSVHACKKKQNDIQLPVDISALDKMFDHEALLRANALVAHNMLGCPQQSLNYYLYFMFMRTVTVLWCCWYTM